jgi:antitoxin component of RelBE/YafQ-DinJ toxin-antitoxin module
MTKIYCDHHGLPFPLRVNIPNDATQQAMNELRDGGRQRFEIHEDLFASWDQK